MYVSMYVFAWFPHSYNNFIGSRSRGAKGPMNSIFAIENHLSLDKWPPNFQWLPLPLNYHIAQFFGRAKL